MGAVYITVPVCLSKGSFQCTSRGRAEARSSLPRSQDDATATRAASCNGTRKDLCFRFAPRTPCIPRSSPCPVRALIGYRTRLWGKEVCLQEPRAAADECGAAPQDGGRLVQAGRLLAYSMR